MLLIDHPPRDIPPREYFNPATNEFISVPGRHIDAIHLKLEHSLISIAAWESKWHQSFIDKENMTPEEFVDYVRCMTISPPKNPDVYMDLEQEDYERIGAYMNDPMSAIDLTGVKKKKNVRRKEAETAESIYFAMFQLGIPMDCEKWHFNRLVALIDYCAEHDGGGGGKGSGAPKPKSQRELMEFYHALNQKNRKKYNSKG